MIVHRLAPEQALQILERIFYVKHKYELLLEVSRKLNILSGTYMKIEQAENRMGEIQTITR